MDSSNIPPAAPGLELVRNNTQHAPADVLAGIVDRVLVETEASGAALALEADGKVICRARAGVSAPMIGAELNRESGLSGLCLRTADLVRCDDAAHDERVDAEAASALGIRSIVAVPVIVNGRSIGLLEVFSRDAYAFGTREEGILLAAVAELLAAVKGDSLTMWYEEGTEIARSHHDRLVEGRETPAAPTVETRADDGASMHVAQGEVSPSIDPVEFEAFSGVSDGKPNRLLILVLAIVALLAIGAVLLSGGISDRKGRMTSQVALLTRTAQAGDAAAQYQLALRYRDGDGVAKNDAESVRWLKEAARQGNADAQYELANAYLAGRGVEKDPVYAYACYAVAGANGNGAGEERMTYLAPTLTSGQVAQVRATVAEMHLHGRGTPQDYKAAYMWFTLAEYAGNSESMAAKRAFASKMTKAQMAAAQREAEEWIKRHAE